MLSLFSAPLLAALDWSGFTSAYGIAIAVTLLMLLIGHVIAAKLLIPNPRAAAVLGAFLLHIVFAVVVLPISALFALSGAGFFGPAALLLILLGGAITAGIYKVGVGRGIAYNFAVLLSITGIAWGATKVLESKYNPFVYFYGKDGKGSGAEAPLAGADQRAAASAPSQPPVFANAQEAQAAALQRYPDLGKAGSPFNTRFLARHRAYKDRNDPILNSPDWPISIAQEVAGELKVP